MQRNSSFRLISLIVVSATVVLLLLTGCPSPTNGAPQEYEITLRVELVGDRFYVGQSAYLHRTGFGHRHGELQPATGSNNKL